MKHNNFYSAVILLGVLRELMPFHTMNAETATVAADHFRAGTSC